MIEGGRRWDGKTRKNEDREDKERRRWSAGIKGWLKGSE